MSFKKMMAAIFIANLMVAIPGCGGKDHGTSVNPTPTEPQVVITTLGSARVEKTIQPGVFQFADNAELTKLDDTSFKVANLPGGFQTGSVFTWRDRAFVATALSSANGASIISFRLAEFSEVLSDLKIQGDLSAADLDQSSLNWDESAELSNSSPPAAQPEPSSQSTRLLAAAPPNFAAKCEIKQETGGGLRDNVSCTVDRVFEDRIAYTGTLGVKKLRFNNVNFSVKENKIAVGTRSGTFYADSGVKIVGKTNQEQELKLDIPLVRVNAGIPQTLGFVHVEIPLGIDVAMPFFKFQVSASFEMPLDNPAAWKVAVHTPVATTATDLTFKYEVSDAFVGAKAGVELVVGLPPLKTVQWLAEAKADPKSRLLAAGAFYKAGYGGLLGLDAKPDGYCFQYGLLPQSGYLFEVSAALGDFSVKAKWKSVPTQPFEVGKIEGHTGSSCDADNSAWHATFKVQTCDASLVFGSGYPCNPHGGWGFGSWTNGFFWRPRAQAPIWSTNGRLTMAPLPDTSTRRSPSANRRRSLRFPSVTKYFHLPGVIKKAQARRSLVEPGPALMRSTT